MKDIIVVLEQVVEVVEMVVDDLVMVDMGYQSLQVVVEVVQSWLFVVEG